MKNSGKRRDYGKSVPEWLKEDLIYIILSQHWNSLKCIITFRLVDAQLLKMMKGYRQRSKHWCLTLNNPTEADAVVEPGKDGSPFVYLILQREKGEGGTPHLQGYCVFKKLTYLSSASKIWPRAHLEVKRGTAEEARHYCMKPVLDCSMGSKGGECKHCTAARKLGQVSNFVEFGKLELQREVASRVMKTRWEVACALAVGGKVYEVEPSFRLRYLHNLKMMAKDNPIIPMNLKEKENYWIVAPTQYGKSHYARKRWPDFYDKSPNKWWTGYLGQGTVLCDDFGPKQFKHLGWYFKRWADLYSFPMETKGGGRQIRPQRIVVTSQYYIVECFEDGKIKDAIDQRFQIIELEHWDDKGEGRKRKRVGVDYVGGNLYPGRSQKKRCCHRNNYCLGKGTCPLDWKYCNMTDHAYCHDGTEEVEKEQTKSYKAFMTEPIIL